MGDNQGGYIARRPRHRATGSTGLCVQVERAPGKGPGSIGAELVDLSRTGVRLRTAVPLAVGEPITVRLSDEQSGLKLTRSGSVRWQSRDERGTWSVGCLFDQRVDWETLGELFLSEILSTDRPATHPADAPNADPAPAEASGDWGWRPFDS